MAIKPMEEETTAPNLGEGKFFFTVLIWPRNTSQRPDTSHLSHQRLQRLLQTNYLTHSLRILACCHRCQ